MTSMRTSSTAAIPFHQRTWVWLVPVGLLALASLGWFIDVPLSLAAMGGKIPKIFSNYLSVNEPFGNGLGIIVILLLIGYLDRDRIWALPRFAMCALGAGMVTNIFKLFIGRLRPIYAKLEGGFFDNNVTETFVQAFPFVNMTGGKQSFPSSHTAAAFGLALALIWLYPKGRIPFLLLALCVGLQRIDAGLHYYSDVCVAAACGWAFALYCLGPTRLGKWFDRWEPVWAVRWLPSSTRLKLTLYASAASDAAASHVGPPVPHLGRPAKPAIIDDEEVPRRV